MRFKKKKLTIDAVYNDLHQNQISSMVKDGDIVITASNDLSIAWNNLSESPSEFFRPILRLGIESKLNDIAGSSR